MTDDAERDPEATLAEWKESMQAEHETAIAEPDPDAEHRIEGVVQVSYRVAYEYDADAGELVVTEERQVDERGEPELLSCSCGVRGMTPEEAREHAAAAPSASTDDPSANEPGRSRVPPRHAEGYTSVPAGST